MDNNTLQLKLKLRLNKLASNDHDNIAPWMLAEAFNKAQLEFVRRSVKGLSPRQGGDESTKMSIDDLQKITKEKPLKGKSKETYFESDEIPDNYLYYKEITAYASSECCKRKPLVVYLDNNSDVNQKMNDNLSSPNFDWSETFATLNSDRVRVYQKDFVISDIILKYYRKPREVEFAGSYRTIDGSPITEDVTCEFHDDLVEVLVDEAVSILARDLESINVFQGSRESNERNN